jgi:hypothetical protein
MLNKFDGPQSRGTKPGDNKNTVLKREFAAELVSLFVDQNFSMILRPDGKSGLDNNGEK